MVVSGEIFGFAYFLALRGLRPMSGLYRAMLKLHVWGIDGPHVLGCNDVHLFFLFFSFFLLFYAVKNCSLVGYDVRYIH